MELLEQFLAQDSLTRHLVVLGTGLLTAWLAYLLLRRVMVAVARHTAKRTRFEWDDIVVESGVFARLALLAPAFMTALLANLVEPWAWAITRAANVFLLMAGLGVMDSVLTALVNVYQQRPVARRRPIKVPVQLLKIFLFALGAVAGVAFVLGKSPWGLLSGIGAFTAVLMLVFRDTILSFVAGMQIVAGDLIRKGDWLEIPAFGADGDVIDIALHTVRVQNFDMTVVAVPTHKLMTSGFKNWRGMDEAGGRRIKRSLVIDQTSVSFVDDSLLSSLKKIQLLEGYLTEKEQEISGVNEREGVDSSHPVNGRRLTNMGCYRAYLLSYLQARRGVRNDMTLMVRQLAPTEEGIPLEVYCFTGTTDWEAYEAIQSDIFDHAMAALPWFRLRAYQRSLGADKRTPEVLP